MVGVGVLGGALGGAFEALAGAARAVPLAERVLEATRVLTAAGKAQRIARWAHEFRGALAAGARMGVVEAGLRAVGGAMEKEPLGETFKNAAKTALETTAFVTLFHYAGKPAEAAVSKALSRVPKLAPKTIQVALPKGTVAVAVQHPLVEAAQTIAAWATGGIPSAMAMDFAQSIARAASPHVTLKDALQEYTAQWSLSNIAHTLTNDALTGALMAALHLPGRWIEWKQITPAPTPMPPTTTPPTTAPPVGTPQAPTGAPPGGAPQTPTGAPARAPQAPTGAPQTQAAQPPIPPVQLPPTTSEAVRLEPDALEAIMTAKMTKPKFKPAPEHEELTKWVKELFVKGITEPKPANAHEAYTQAVKDILQHAIPLRDAMSKSLPFAPDAAHVASRLVAEEVLKDELLLSLDKRGIRKPPTSEEEWKAVAEAFKEASTAAQQRMADLARTPDQSFLLLPDFREAVEDLVRKHLDIKVIAAKTKDGVKVTIEPHLKTPVQEVIDEAAGKVGTLYTGIAKIIFGQVIRDLLNLQITDALSEIANSPQHIVAALDDTAKVLSDPLPDEALRASDLRLYMVADDIIDREWVDVLKSILIQQVPEGKRTPLMPVIDTVARELATLLKPSDFVDESTRKTRRSELWNMLKGKITGFMMQRATEMWAAQPSEVARQLRRGGLLTPTMTHEEIETHLEGEGWGDVYRTLRPESREQLVREALREVTEALSTHGEAIKPVVIALNEGFRKIIDGITKGEIKGKDIQGVLARPAAPDAWEAVGIPEAAEALRDYKASDIVNRAVEATLKGDKLPEDLNPADAWLVTLLGNAITKTRAELKRVADEALIHNFDTFYSLVFEGLRRLPQDPAEGLRHLSSAVMIVEGLRDFFIEGKDIKDKEVFEAMRKIRDEYAERLGVSYKEAEELIKDALLAYRHPESNASYLEAFPYGIAEFGLRWFFGIHLPVEMARLMTTPQSDAKVIDAATLREVARKANLSAPPQSEAFTEHVLNALHEALELLRAGEVKYEVPSRVGRRKIEEPQYYLAGYILGRLAAMKDESVLRQLPKATAQRFWNIPDSYFLATGAGMKEAKDAFEAGWKVGLQHTLAIKAGVELPTEVRDAIPRVTYIPRLPEETERPPALMPPTSPEATRMTPGAEVGAGRIIVTTPPEFPALPTPEPERPPEETTPPAEAAPPPPAETPATPEIMPEVRRQIERTSRRVKEARKRRNANKQKTPEEPKKPTEVVEAPPQIQATLPVSIAALKYHIALLDVSSEEKERLTKLLAKDPAAAFQEVKRITEQQINETVKTLDASLEGLGGPSGGLPSEYSMLRPSPHILVPPDTEKECKARLNAPLQKELAIDSKEADKVIFQALHNPFLREILQEIAQVRGKSLEEIVNELLAQPEKFAKLIAEVQAATLQLKASLALYDAAIVTLRKAYPEKLEGYMPSERQAEEAAHEGSEAYVKAMALMGEEVTPEAKNFVMRLLKGLVNLQVLSSAEYGDVIEETVKLTAYAKAGKEEQQEGVKNLLLTLRDLAMAIRVGGYKEETHKEETKETLEEALTQQIEAEEVSEEAVDFERRQSAREVALHLEDVVTEALVDILINPVVARLRGTRTLITSAREVLEETEGTTLAEKAVRRALNTIYRSILHARREWREMLREKSTTEIPFEEVERLELEEAAAEETPRSALHELALLSARMQMHIERPSEGLSLLVGSIAQNTWRSMVTNPQPIEQTADPNAAASVGEVIGAMIASSYSLEELFPPIMNVANFARNAERLASELGRLRDIYGGADPDVNVRWGIAQTLKGFTDIAEALRGGKIEESLVRWMELMTRLREITTTHEGLLESIVGSDRLKAFAEDVERRWHRGIETMVFLGKVKRAMTELEDAWEGAFKGQKPTLQEITEMWEQRHQNPQGLQNAINAISNLLVAANEVRSGRSRQMAHERFLVGLVADAAFQQACEQMAGHISVSSPITISQKLRGKMEELTPDEESLISLFLAQLHQKDALIPIITSTFLRGRSNEAFIKLVTREREAQKSIKAIEQKMQPSREAIRKWVDAHWNEMWGMLLTRFSTGTRRLIDGQVLIPDASSLKEALTARIAIMGEMAWEKPYETPDPAIMPSIWQDVLLQHAFWKLDMLRQAATDPRARDMIANAQAEVIRTHLQTMPAFAFIPQRLEQRLIHLTEVPSETTQAPPLVASVMLNGHDVTKVMQHYASSEEDGRRLRERLSAWLADWDSILQMTQREGVKAGEVLSTLVRQLNTFKKGLSDVRQIYNRAVGINPARHLFEFFASPADNALAMLASAGRAAIPEGDRATVDALARSTLALLATKDRPMTSEQLKATQQALTQMRQASNAAYEALSEEGKRAWDLIHGAIYEAYTLTQNIRDFLRFANEDTLKAVREGFVVTSDGERSVTPMGMMMGILPPITGNIGAGDILGQAAWSAITPLAIYHMMGHVLNPLLRQIPEYRRFHDMLIDMWKHMQEPQPSVTTITNINELLDALVHGKPIMVHPSQIEKLQGFKEILERLEEGKIDLSEAFPPRVYLTHTMAPPIIVIEKFTDILGREAAKIGVDAETAKAFFQNALFLGALTQRQRIEQVDLPQLLGIIGAAHAELLGNQTTAIDKQKARSYAGAMGILKALFVEHVRSPFLTQKWAMWHETLGNILHAVHQAIQQHPNALPADEQAINIAIFDKFVEACRYADSQKIDIPRHVLATDFSDILRKFYGSQAVDDYLRQHRKTQLTLEDLMQTIRTRFTVTASTAGGQTITETLRVSPDEYERFKRASVYTIWGMQELYNRVREYEEIFGDTYKRRIGDPLEHRAFYIPHMFDLSLANFAHNALNTAYARMRSWLGLTEGGLANILSASWQSWRELAKRHREVEKALGMPSQERSALSLLLNWVIRPYAQRERRIADYLGWTDPFRAMVRAIYSGLQFSANIVPVHLAERIAVALHRGAHELRERGELYQAGIYDMLHDQLIDIVRQQLHLPPAGANREEIAVYFAKLMQGLRAVTGWAIIGFRPLVLLKNLTLSWGSYFAHDPLVPPIVKMRYLFRAFYHFLTDPEWRRLTMAADPAIAQVDAKSYANLLDALRATVPQGLPESEQARFILYQRLMQWLKSPQKMPERVMEEFTNLLFRAADSVPRRIIYLAELMRAMDENQPLPVALTRARMSSLAAQAALVPGGIPRASRNELVALLTQFQSYGLNKAYLYAEDLRRMNMTPQQRLDAFLNFTIALAVDFMAAAGLAWLVANNWDDFKKLLWRSVAIDIAPPLYGDAAYRASEAWRRQNIVAHAEQIASRATSDLSTADKLTTIASALLHTGTEAVGRGAPAMPALDFLLDMAKGMQTLMELRPTSKRLKDIARRYGIPEDEANLLTVLEHIFEDPAVTASHIDDVTSALWSTVVLLSAATRGAVPLVPETVKNAVQGMLRYEALQRINPKAFTLTEEEWKQLNSLQRALYNYKQGLSILRGMPTSGKTIEWLALAGTRQRYDVIAETMRARLPDPEKVNPAQATAALMDLLVAAVRNKTIARVVTKAYRGDYGIGKGTIQDKLMKLAQKGAEGIVTGKRKKVLMSPEILKETIERLEELYGEIEARMR
ncbi:MAG: hypothetical protein QXH20_01560 [Candidatus Bathyarchaeia archaeon]